MLQKWWAGFPGPSHTLHFGLLWFLCSPFPFCWPSSEILLWASLARKQWGLLFLWLCSLVVSFWVDLLQVPANPGASVREGDVSWAVGSGDSEVLREAGWPPLGGSQPLAGKIGCVCKHKPWLTSSCLAEAPASQSLAGLGECCLPVCRFALHRRFWGLYLQVGSWDGSVGHRAGDLNGFRILPLLILAHL